MGTRPCQAPHATITLDRHPPAQGGTAIATKVNETTFPHELAKLLADPSAADELNADKDETISLFDLYLTLTRWIAQSYAGQKQLSTEHAQLDDNGDGRGTEVQIDYLSEQLGGRNTPGLPPPRLDSSDGHLSSQIVVSLTDPE